MILPYKVGFGLATFLIDRVIATIRVGSLSKVLDTCGKHVLSLQRIILVESMDVSKICVSYYSASPITLAKRKRTIFRSIDIFLTVT